MTGECSRLQQRTVEATAAFCSLARCTRALIRFHSTRLLTCLMWAWQRERWNNTSLSSGSRLCALKREIDNKRGGWQAHVLVSWSKDDDHSENVIWKCNLAFLQSFLDFRSIERLGDENRQWKFLVNCFLRPHNRKTGHFTSRKEQERLCNVPKWKLHVQSVSLLNSKHMETKSYLWRASMAFFWNCWRSPLKQAAKNSLGTIR